MYGRLPQATVILRRSEWAGGRRRSRRTFARVWAKGRPPTRRSEWPHRGPPHDNVRVSSFPPPGSGLHAYLLRFESSRTPRFRLCSAHDARRWEGAADETGGTGFGLKGIRERAEQLQGSANYRTAPCE